MALFRRKKTITVGDGDDGLQPVQRPEPNYAPRAADLTVGDYANGMPNIRLGEMLKSFGRQLFWVVPLFLIGSAAAWHLTKDCLLYTSPSPRDKRQSRMPSSA